MIYATAGHVDHGKTSLVKALSGIDTDRLAEEKARGLTIDLGFAYCDNGDNRIGFVDVPGHAKFISNMLAGVATIDHALIVIAADDGPMPQTLEHIAILELLGIKKATVVITKIDRVSEEHLAATQSSVETLMASTQFSRPNIFLTSTESNEGISTLKQHLFSQPTNKTSQSAAFFRLAVDRKFTIKGAGVVVTGSVFSGSVNVGDELWLMPRRKQVRLRGLHRQDKTDESAAFGDRCSLNLSGDIEQSLVSRGDWITSHPNLPVSRRMDVELDLLSSESIPLKTGTPIHIHIGAQHTTGRVFLLEQRHLTPSSTALAQIVTEAEVSSCFGDRIVIRDQTASRTLGGGRVIDPFSVLKGRSKPERIELLGFLKTYYPSSNTNGGDSANNSETSIVDQALDHAPNGLNLSQFCASQNIALTTKQYPQDTFGNSYPVARVDELKTATLQLLAAKPLHVKEVALRLDIKPRLTNLILTTLQSEKKIVQQNGLYELANQKPALSKPAESLWVKIEPILKQAPLQPPVISELAKQVNLPPGALDKLLGECIKQGLVARPVKNRYFLTSALKTLRATAKTVATNHGGEFSVIEFRDHSGIGRNLCIELLEHLDSKGYTKRMGDKRIIQDELR